MDIGTTQSLVTVLMPRFIKAVDKVGLQLSGVQRIVSILTIAITAAIALYCDVLKRRNEVLRAEVNDLRAFVNAPTPNAAPGALAAPVRDRTKVA